MYQHRLRLNQGPLAGLRLSRALLDVLRCAPSRPLLRWWLNRCHNCADAFAGRARFGIVEGLLWGRHVYLGLCFSTYTRYLYRCSRRGAMTEIGRYNKYRPDNQQDQEPSDCCRSHAEPPSVLRPSPLLRWNLACPESGQKRAAFVRRVLTLDRYVRNVVEVFANHLLSLDWSDSTESFCDSSRSY